MPRRRLTSVPLRRRAVGWVTSPPGFETTSRKASSNTTGTGGRSATSATSSARSTTTCSPPPKRNDFGLGRPSTDTLPSAIARWTSARLEPVVAATTASSRPATATNPLRGIVHRRVSAPGINSIVRSTSACAAHTLVSRSSAKTAAAVVNKRGAARRARASTGLPVCLCLGVLEAEADVGKGLHPCLLDRLPTALADPVRAGVDPREGSVDLLQEVTHVLLERKVLLAFERCRPGVSGLIVEAHIAGEIGLRRRERGVFDRGQLFIQLRSLVEQASLQIGYLARGEPAVRHGGEG